MEIRATVKESGLKTWRERNQHQFGGICLMGIIKK